MRKLSPRLGSLILFAGALAFSPLISSVHANPVDVSYTISGAPGDWIVDVSFTDNLGGTNDLYFVGIKLPNTNIVNSPANWAAAGTWVTPSGTIYNNTWCVTGCSFPEPPLIVPGHTLGGFEALDTSLIEPTSMDWFAYATFGFYSGPGCFQCGTNPGFEGTVAATPLPAALPLFATGLGAMGLFGWRKRRKSRALT
jgi:hypothetical protein